MDAMSILHINARSIVNIFDNIKTFIAQLQHQPSYICISETWLSPDIENRFSLEDQSYVSHCKSRADRPGGGSAIFALRTKKLNIKEISIFEFKTADVITIQITNSYNQKYLICQIYRAPDNNMEFLNELEQVLSKINELNILT